jgi:L-rhamnose mutarotase
MNKIRKAFLIYLQAEKAEEYIKRHNPIWPELEKELKKYGVSNYSIFLHPNNKYLFGYYEVEDESLFDRIEESEVCVKWWKYMTEVLICNSKNDEKAIEDILQEIFHLN